MNSKKGVSQYIAWILLVGLAIALGAIMFAWTRGFATQQVDDLESRTDNVMCDNVAFEISGACQNSQTLNMNLTNTNNLRIEKIKIIFLDLYGNSETKDKIIELSTGDALRISVLKQGTLASARVTPVTIKENKEIICQRQSILLENIIQC